MKVKLAEALLRRKELMHKVSQLHQLKEKDCLREVLQRISVNEGLDEVRGVIPVLKAKDLTREFDFYAGELRKLDGRIQQANWTTEIEVSEDAMRAFLEDDE